MKGQSKYEKDDRKWFRNAVKLTTLETEALNQIEMEGGCATATASEAALKTLGGLLAKGLVRPVVAWQMTAAGQASLSEALSLKLKRRRKC